MTARNARATGAAPRRRPAGLPNHGSAPAAFCPAPGAVRLVPAALLLAALLAAVSLSACAGSAASAGEYYAIGMAYFDLGKYEEAARWLERARGADRTRIASEYTLGRIAFAQNDYAGALSRFESILRKDPRNVTALRAAAYTFIRLDRAEDAEAYYARVLELAPESADSGYSYAVVLFALGKPAEAEATLLRYPESLTVNRDAPLLLARARAAQDKVEAINDYGEWLSGGDDAQVRYEYARALESGGFYARAVEEYRRVLALGGPGGPAPADVRFALGRVLVIADGGSAEGAQEIEAAVTAGFQDQAALEALIADSRVSAPRKEELRRVLAAMSAPPPQAE